MTRRKKSQVIQPLFDMREFKEVMKEGKEMLKEINELAGHAEQITGNLSKMAEGADDSQFEKVETEDKTKLFVSKELPPMSINAALNIMKLTAEATPAEITAKFQEFQKKCISKAEFIKLYAAYKKLMEKHKHFVVKGKPRVVNEP